MKAYGTGYTDIGKRRSRNEDALLIDDELGVYAVSDGMGGHAGGDVAAHEAVAAVERYMRSQRYLLERIRAGRVAQGMLSSLAGIAVAQASRAIHRKSLERPELEGMGCTLTVLLIGRDKAAMAHVGDSRLYLGRRGTMIQLSSDHTLAEEYVNMGLISADEKDLIPQGNALARAVGVRETVRVDEALFSVQTGDQFILCSDGVWGYLEEAEEMAEFLEHVPVERAAESLVMFANSVGGRDNATAVVVTIESGDMQVDSGEWRLIRRELECAITAELPPAIIEPESSSPDITCPA